MKTTVVRKLRFCVLAFLSFIQEALSHFKTADDKRQAQACRLSYTWWTWHVWLTKKAILLPSLMSHSALKTRDASRHLNASLQFFKPRPNLPFELNMQANEWYTAPALRNNNPAVFSCQRACLLRISGVFFLLYGCSWCSNEGTTARGGPGGDFAPLVVVGVWGGEEEHSTVGLWLVPLLRTSPWVGLSGTKCSFAHTKPWNEEKHKNNIRFFL